MNVMHSIAEARATALSLRASAGACGPEQGPLKFRLTRAAESLDMVVSIAVRGIERIEELEQQIKNAVTLSPRERTTLLLALDVWERAITTELKPAVLDALIQHFAEIRAKLRVGGAS